MLSIWLYSILSVLIVSAISLIGAVALLFNRINTKKALVILVSFAAGALLGDVFIHLLPEAVEGYGFTIQLSLYTLAGIIVFFVLEKYIHWRHCHKTGTCDVHDAKDPHGVAKMNLFGDGLHNFIDGMIVAGSYIASIPLGIATTLAVIFHEIPQEIGDFGVLLHGGFTRKKALFFNLMSALLAVAGALVVLLIQNISESFSLFLIPFTAGGFIYIASADLIPELHKENNPFISLMQFITFILGIAVMLLLTFLE